MNLSIETKVAAVVAAGFLVVSVGVVAQGNSTGQSPAPDNSSRIVPSEIYQHADQQAFGTQSKTSSSRDRHQ